MKTIVNLLMATTLLMFGLSEANAQRNKFITGSGNVVTKTVNTSDYDSVNFVGSMDVTLESGSEGNISVTTDDNLHDIVEISCVGKTLKIKLTNNVSFKSSDGIRITVPFKDLEEVTLVGSGDVSSKDMIKAPMLDLSLTGSGDIELPINSNNVNAKVTGSGDMVLNGTATTLEIKVVGSGDFEGSSLNSEKTQAYVSGSGDISVKATSSIKARVHGSGTIKYTGSPNSNDEKVMGSGSIKSM